MWKNVLLETSQNSHENTCAREWILANHSLNQNKTTIRRKKNFWGGGGGGGGGGKFHLLYKGNVPFRSFNCKETDAKEFTDKAVLYDI